MRHPCARRGFSLIELLVVVGLLIGLMGISVPVYFSVIKGLSTQRTRGLVKAIAAAIATYPATTVSIPGGGVRRLWDFDGDGILDGDPAKSFVGLNIAQADKAGYRGFLIMTATALEKRHMEPGGSLRIVDGWKRPLRISFSAGGEDHTYGPSGIGVWSFGKSGPSTANPSKPAVEADVIASWKDR